jgi:cell division protein FtsW
MFRSLGQRTTVKEDALARRRRERAERRSFQSQTIVSGNLGFLGNSQPEDPPVSMARAKTRKPVQLGIDGPLLVVLIALLIFGLIMVYSASYDYSRSFNNGDATMIFRRQLLWLALGTVGLLFMTFSDYHYWQKWAVAAMIVTVVALVGVLIVNEMINFATRTFYKGSVQPSELAKLITVIYLAVWLYAKGEKLNDINFGLLPLAAILGLLGGLIILQPDLSAVFTIFALGGMMFFLAGGDLKQIAILLVVALIVGWIVVQLSPTGSGRIGPYLAGLKDPTEGAYQVRRSFEAFVKGGWLGVGIGKGSVKLTGLPVPQTDSIFAVVGEETGVLGSIGLVVLYALMLWRGMAIARRAPDRLGSLLAAGMSLWLALEAFINMSVMVNILPFAGNALPFISSGGSNLIVSMAAIGVLLNVSRLSVKREENGNLFNAVVNLRGRDRGRRVPGSSRPSSPAEGTRTTRRRPEQSA